MFLNREHHCCFTAVLRAQNSHNRLNSRSDLDLCISKNSTVHALINCHPTIYSKQVCHSFCFVFFAKIPFFVSLLLKKLIPVPGLFTCDVSLDCSGMVYFWTFPVVFRRTICPVAVNLLCVCHLVTFSNLPITGNEY